MHIPDDRIKTLSITEMMREDDLNEVLNEEVLKKAMIHRVGMAIAEKLFEFNKVLIQRNSKDGMCILFTEIKVIVPEGKPKCPA